VKDVEAMEQNVSYTAPDFVSMALITIDTQRDTLDGGPLEIPGTSAILPRMRRLLQTFRKIEMPIVHMIRLYKEDGSNVDLCRRSMVESGAAILRPGSPGSELAGELLPEPDTRLDAELLLSGGIQQVAPQEVIIYKPRWGAFFKTPLEAHLQELGVSSLASMGCNFPNCPRTSIYEASERDFRIVLVEDAVSGLYERGTEEMRNIGVRPMSTSELEKAVVAANAAVLTDIGRGRST
jgi:nicotinamidase-related amidase